MCVQVTYLLDDVGIPADYRHMNGSSVNTYSLINKSGGVNLVKFRWVPSQGEALFHALSQGKKF